MSDAMHKHDAYPACDFVDYPIVSHTDTPVILAARQFAASGWSWVRRARLDSIYYAAMDI